MNAHISGTPFQAFQNELLPPMSELRRNITDAYRRDEQEAVQSLLQQLQNHAELQTPIQNLARGLVSNVRKERTRASGVDALMHEFSLSSEEGVALMCLAEALLRIPDSATKSKLIADKISKGDWRKHLGESPSLFVNAATWGLLITGKLVGSYNAEGLGAALTRILAKGGEPLIRKGVDMSMKMLGNQFVTGQTIEEALQNAQVNEARGYRYSYDMLGEAALTAHDAALYFKAYEMAIHAIGKVSNGRGIRNGPGISVKLSALHPRYSRAQHARVMQELLPLLKKLLVLAKQYQIGLNIDAEESDRLELSLDLLEALAFDADLEGFEGLGFVVQAYQKRCPYVIDYIVDLAKRSQRKFMVRLVKGAYWDSEIKRAQVDGLSGYPVYTRKVYTDVSYLTCAQKLLANADVIYPQFATHNALSLSTIYEWAKKANVTEYEFQCLHGMGETLYDQVVGKDKLDKPCRIYAPVGSHQTLLAYLVRRLLENGANSSFVNQIVDEKVNIETLIKDPVQIVRELGGKPHSAISLPVGLFNDERKNSRGFDFSNELELTQLAREFTRTNAQQIHATPLVGNGVLIAEARQVEAREVLNPANHMDAVGRVLEANSDDVQQALAIAAQYAPKWEAVSHAERGRILAKAGDLLEAQIADFMALAVREAGKSLPNAVAEVREAVDFLRYYAVEIAQSQPAKALGPVVCISPWNFPLAIFIGEVAASLAAGNVVLAKPAEQTPLIAYKAVQLLHEAGVPQEALQFLPGLGEVVGAALVSDARTKAVIFTGSTEVAQIINRTLAKRSIAEGQNTVLIAETGGQNALIVDSSALPEQVVNDVMSSAFDSAGQRCSALRVLCLQEDIADKTIEMLKGAMQELRVGCPDRLSTDIGPVIDKEAQTQLQNHIAAIRSKAKSFYCLNLPKDCEQGTFVPPTVMEIHSLADLTKEVFGPVLHVLRYQRDALPQLIDAINATGFGLTLGVHSRIDETVNYITSHAHIGNVYVNRNIVGAVVGVQPFGGEGKSGTGPKAGGPLYLKRLQQQASIHFKDAVSVIATKNEVYAAYQAWVAATQSAELSALVSGYATQADNLAHQTVTLPGPTGEANALSFVPRGLVFCQAKNVGALLNQVGAVLATRNTPVMASESKALLHSLNGLPASVANLIQVAHAKEANVQCALIEKNEGADVKLELALKDGAICSVEEVTAQAAIPLWRLVHERALCVNTTAAGGNASLMTLQQ